LCNSCASASLAGLVLCFIARFILLVIAPLTMTSLYIRNTAAVQAYCSDNDVAATKLQQAALLLNFAFIVCAVLWPLLMAVDFAG